MNCLSLIQATTHEWDAIILNYPDFATIDKQLTTEYETYEPDIRILPVKEKIFRAFQLCPLNKLKVVFLGMDPYINIKCNQITKIEEPEANGLSFSVNEGMPMPPSLKNLLKEMESDIGAKGSQDFTYLAKQGILFLNTALTVRQHKTGTHTKIWKKFTDWLIQAISNSKDGSKGLVFILLGNHAQEKKKFIYHSCHPGGAGGIAEAILLAEKKFIETDIDDTTKHIIIEAVHPSPLSANRGFFGSKIYSQCNAALEKLGHTPINWHYGS